METDEIISIDMIFQGVAFDTYHNHAQGAWQAAVDDGNGTVTLDSACIAFWQADGTADATVTYKTTLGQLVTVVVEDVLIAAP